MKRRRCLFIAFVALSGALLASRSATALANEPEFHFAASSVHRMLFTPDDRRLIVFGRYGGLHICDLEAGKRVKTLWLPSYGAAADISPDGTRLAVCHDSKRQGFYVVDLRTDRIAVSGAVREPGEIYDLAFSPDGKTIATVASDRQFKLWDVDKAVCLRTFESKDRVNSVAWSPDGKSLATAEQDGPLRLWDVATGQSRAFKDGSFSSKLLWRPDGNAIAIISHRKWRVVDLSGKTLAENKEDIWFNDVRFDRANRFVIAEYREASGTLQLVDAISRKPATASAAHPRVGNEWALSAGGTLCAWTSGWEGGAVTVTSLIDGAKKIVMPPTPRELTSKVGWSEDGKSLLWTASRSGKSIERRFHLSELRLDTPPAGAVRTVAKWHDAERKIAEDGVYSYALTRTKEGRTLHIEPSGISDGLGVRSVTLLAGERAALNSDYGLALHDTTDGKELFYFRGSLFRMNGVAPAPNGRFFATDGGGICVYSRKRLLLSIYVDGDRWVAWTNDGHYAALWDGDLPIGRIVDRGPDRLAEFTPLNRFKDSDRPDMIRQLLPVGKHAKGLTDEK